MENVILLFMTKPKLENPFKAGLDRRIRNTIDFVLEPRDMEKGGGKSLTVQDDSFTVRELLERHTTGMELSVTKAPIYGEADAELDGLDLEKVKQLDLFDRQELAREYGERIDARVKLRKDEQEARVKAQKEQAEHAEEELEKPVKGVSKSSRFEKSKFIKGKEEGDES